VPRVAELNVPIVKLIDERDEASRLVLRAASNTGMPTMPISAGFRDPI
jgi:hypothetical protein